MSANTPTRAWAAHTGGQGRCADDQRSLKVAVLGAGNVGMAVAAVLATRGNSVRLWNRGARRLAGPRREGGITFEGAIQGHAPLAAVTEDMHAAIGGTAAIIMTTTANAHADLAAQIASQITPEQLILLCPGRTGGALEIVSSLRGNGVENLPAVVELQSAPYLARINGSVARIASIKNYLLAASGGRQLTEADGALVSHFVPQVRWASSLVGTSLGNMGAVLHPALFLETISGRSPDRGALLYQGASPAAMDLAETIDSERVAIAEVLGEQLPTLRQWLADSYGGDPEADLGELLNTNAAYQGVTVPDTVETRLLTEDVPTGLVPMQQLGKALGVSTPAVTDVIARASALVGRDFAEEGRTLARLGLDGLGRSEIKAAMAPDPNAPLVAARLATPSRTGSC